MGTNAILPPAYFSLMGSEKIMNIAKTEDKVPIRDDGAELLVENTFENKTNRIIFIQKVLLIKLLQLIGVTMILVCFVAIYPLEYFVIFSRNWVVYIALASTAYLVVYGLLMFCDKARRKNPYKYMFLVALPVIFAIVIGLIFGHSRIIPLAIMVWLNYGMAIFSVLAYSILANNTKAGFVTGYGILIAICAQTVMFASVPLLGMNSFYVLYPSLVMTLHYIYMICDIQAMTTKNYHTSMTPDDFVDGVINLYIDYVYFFSSRVLPKLCQLWEKWTGETNSIH